MAASTDDDFVADINVTPFVDVMLVLLIIFMVTAPMMTEGLDVALPKVDTSEVLPTEDDHIILTIKSNGALYLDEYETGLADLPEVLTARVKNAGRQLFVRADKDVPYGMVMHVMDRVRGAGVSDVGLVTTSLPDDASGAETGGAATPGSKKDNLQ
ncbi:MAG: protein TolR [Desulfovibrio sp. MES5]|uniref:protein TolR n=1 Tax=Desulfovibrio sp. MES5 TaxID=1899016 RepID=UPI000B9CD116|nr:protein TolR [Desulfovibrio sp. MES5]OXS30128.1 MAG: protein TolR [Desulfovibrio sp. MES5]